MPQRYYKHNKNNKNDHRGRGGGPGRGRGRGEQPRNGVPAAIPPPTSPSPANRAPHPRHRYPHASADIDIEIQQWAEPDVSGNRNRWRGPWGRGTPNSRSGAGTPLSRGTDSPRRGNGTPRGRGQGRGRGRGRENGDPFGTARYPHLGVGSKAQSTRRFLGKDAPLSDLLFAERPLLRPVKFVRATLNPFLFQEPEDVLMPASQIADTKGKSDVPTADRVARVFYGNVSDAASASESEDHAPDGLEEIDFADLAQVRAEVDAIAQATAATVRGASRVDKIEDDDAIEEVDFADLAAMRAKVDATAPLAAAPQEDMPEETFTGVYNHVADATLVLGAMNIIDDDQLDEVRQTTLPSASPLPDDALPFTNKVVNSSDRETTTQELDTILVEEEVPCSTDAPFSLPTEESPEKQPVSIITDDVPLRLDEPHPLFVVDTVPTRPLASRSASDVILVDRAGYGQALGDQDQEDELIVYVAPHPRSGRASPISAVPRVRLPKTSMLTGTGASRDNKEQARETNYLMEEDNVEFGQESNVAVPGPSAAGSSRTWAARKREKKLHRQEQRQRKRDGSGFGSFGTMVSEAQLREEDTKERRHPRWSARRQGDSDLDWGTADEDEQKDEQASDDEMDVLSSGLGGMQIDPDLELDMDAMEGFVKGMGAERSQFVTMDDIEDEAQILQEDEEGEGGPEGSSDSEGDEEDVDEEEDEVFQLEEEIMIAESEDEVLSDDFDDDDDDDDLSPGARFQARLCKVRQRSRGPRSETVRDLSDDEDEGFPDVLPSTRGADDESFIAHTHDLLDENSHILSGRDRKQKKAVFRQLQLHQDEWDVEAFLDDPKFTTPVNKKGKGKKFAGHFAAELEAQWAKDRAKKAERKRRRQEERESARRGSTMTMDVDMDALVAYMRTFASGTKQSLALPPMSKGTRKVVHELAGAFGITSVSKGKGAARYTTLIRKTRSGVGVKEGRVRATMKRYASGQVFENGNRGKRGQGKSNGKRMKEGEEVGGKAPKIGEGNIGFRMLASMGWSEGHSIGGMASVGLEAPLPAIYRHSKLGLGATK